MNRTSPHCPDVTITSWFLQILQQWICTHPVPLHAHTHFLAGLRAALILNAGQAVSAPPPVSLRIFQELHHACLVDWIDAL